MNSRKRTARLAGLLYLAMGIPAFYALMYVPGRIIVKGNPAATADNILAHEFLFRTGIAGHLIGVTLFLILVFVLYRLLKQVNEHQAKLMVALVVVQVPIVFLIETFRITCLLMLKGQVFNTLEPEQVREMAMLFLKIHGYGSIALELFMGLWLLPFGQLIYRSGFIPRILGVLLILAGIAYTVDSLTYMLYPGYREFTQPVAYAFSTIGEVPTMLWLMIKGVSDNNSNT